MDLFEAMEHRHAVRSYEDRPIAPEAREALLACIAQCNRESGLHIQLVLDEPRGFGGLPAHYGKFSGVKNYIALIGKKSPNLEEACGYYGEKIVLRAQQLGLNTCWVAMTYSKVKTAFQIAPGEIHPEPSGRKTHVRSRDGIAVTDREIPEFEIADHRPAAKQRQQGDVERQPSAADKRVPALSQQHVVRRQAERKSEPDAADRKFHAERPGDGPFRPDAHEVLHRRDIERCGNQDQRRDEAQQRAERIFDDFSPVHFSRRRPEASTFRDRPSKTTASYENSGSCPKAFRHIRPDSRHLSFFLPAGCPGTAETARFFPRSPAVPKRPPP